MLAGNDFVKLFLHSVALARMFQGMLLRALSHGGERSEPEWDSARRSGAAVGCLRSRRPRGFVSLPGQRVPSDRWFFLRKQENQAGTFAQEDVGGVRELVQPLDGRWPVRSPAGAAHALCSKLEPLPERQLSLSARICKDELEHD